MIDDPLWFKNAVFYQVYIRAFADGNGDGQGDFPGLTARLDYFVELGIDCIWLSPMYPSPRVDDGYDIMDYCGIHPDYGTLDQFGTFLAAAHARGLRVIADLVLNHTSDQHPWFTAARSSRESPFHAFYLWSDSGQEFGDARIIFVDSQPSNWQFDAAIGQYYFHRFYPQQPDLNYDNPAVRAAMTDVVRFWLDMGLDGFRADAVPYLYKRDGTNCENLPETHAFLKDLRRLIERDYPGRILLAEANQWAQDASAYFGCGDEFHMVFHFPLMPRLYEALALGERGPIEEILRSTPAIPDGCQWCTFLRNHDELTLEMVTEEERGFLWQVYAPEPRMRLNRGIRRRLAPLVEGDRRRIELLNSLLFCSPGSPILYYGDEIGMGDNIWLLDRTGVRTPMQWDAGANAGFSAAPVELLYAPLVVGDGFDYRRVNVAAQKADAGSLWHSVRRMIATVRAHPSLRGEHRILPLANRAVLAMACCGSGEALVALHNLSPRPQPVEPLTEIGLAAGGERLLGNDPGRPDVVDLTSLVLRPYEHLWVEACGC